MKYLYYKLWQTFKRIKTNDTPATNAMILLSCVQGVNLLILQILIKHIFQIEIKFVSKDAIMLFAALVGIALMTINYFILYKKREEIYDNYKNESKNKSWIGFIFLLFYIFGSAALVYVVGSNFPL